MLYDPTSGLTVEGQVLREARKVLGLSNDACPLCEDPDSFGDPCEVCWTGLS
jgi:hypothetical protein